MKRIHRYILAELIKCFAVSLGAITMLTVLLFLAQEGLKQGLTFTSILQLIPYVLPNALYVAVPGTMLFAACLVYGRMSASNEIVAVKSLGVSSFRIIWPALLLAMMLSLLTVWLNDIAVSWGRQGVYQVVLRSVETTIYSTLRSNKSFANRHLSISVAEVNDRDMLYPIVIVPDSDPEKTKTISAETAQIHCYPDRGVLSVTLVNGTVSFGDGNSFHFDTISPEISLDNLTRKKGNLRSPSNYSLRELPVMVVRQDEAESRVRRSMAMNASIGLVGGDMSMLSPASWRRDNQQVKNIQQRRMRLRTESWRRWSNGFSCLFFVVVGIPLAIRLKNADVWTSFGICFIPILLVYFPLMLFAVDRAKAGAFPPHLVWIGNGVLLIVGAILLRKQLKH